MNKFLQEVALFLLSIVALFFRLSVLCKMWAMVCVPMGAPELDISHAFAVSLMFELFNPMLTKADTDDSEKSQLTRIFYVFGISGISWLLCYWAVG